MENKLNLHFLIVQFSILINQLEIFKFSYKFNFHLSDPPIFKFGIVMLSISLI